MERCFRTRNSELISHLQSWVSRTSLQMESTRWTLSLPASSIHPFKRPELTPSPGGGTAGCIIAGRLAEASPDLSILVIEQGANNKDVPHIVNPVFYLQNLLPTTKTALFYKGNKAPQLADREPIVPCGGTLGGGSSINFMMYTRAQRSDFDSWKTEGWTANEMLPHMKKV